jgi:hypothetical protein
MATIITRQQDFYYVRFRDPSLSMYVHVSPSDSSRLAIRGTLCGACVFEKHSAEYLIREVLGKNWVPVKINIPGHLDTLQVDGVLKWFFIFAKMKVRNGNLKNTKPKIQNTFSKIGKSKRDQFFPSCWWKIKNGKMRNEKSTSIFFHLWTNQKKIQPNINHPKCDSRTELDTQYIYPCSVKKFRRVKCRRVQFASSNVAHPDGDIARNIQVM